MVLRETTEYTIILLHWYSVLSINYGTTCMCSSKGLMLTWPPGPWCGHWISCIQMVELFHSYLCKFDHFDYWGLEISIEKSFVRDNLVLPVFWGQCDILFLHLVCCGSYIFYKLRSQISWLGIVPFWNLFFSLRLVNGRTACLLPLALQTRSLALTFRQDGHPALGFSPRESPRLCHCHHCTCTLLPRDLTGFASLWKIRFALDHGDTTSITDLYSDQSGNLKTGVRRII